MNSQQARDILLLYRPGTDDRGEPDMAKALDLAARDPELSKWFEDHCRLQEALRAKFRQISVPDGLKEQIVSERKAHTSGLVSRRSSLYVGIGAVVALLLALSSLFYRPATEDRRFSGFERRMTALALRSYPRMDLVTNNLPAIQSYLSTRGRGDFSLPDKLAAAAVTGCAVLPWQNKPVTMICFNSGKTANPAEPDVFLFVIANSDAPGAPDNDQPSFAQRSRLATATWSAGGKVYLLETLGEAQDLKRYL